MIDRRRADLERHLDELRRLDGWHPFQNFVLGLLRHEGYTDVRHSAARSDFGRDAVAVTPDGKRCVVAVSFECTKSKVLHDAKRWTEDPNREPAEVLLFITSEAPAETTWSKWKKDVEKHGLKLRLFNRETILQVATREDIWRETCARLGITGHRPGFRLISPYDGDLVRAALQARPAEWLAKRIELREWSQLQGELRNRLILGKPGAGKTTTLYMHLEANRPDRVLVVEPDLRSEQVGDLVDAAAGGGVIVFDDAHEKPNELRALLGALRARLRDVPEVSARYRDVRLLIAARSQEWAEIQPPFSRTELQDLQLTSSAHIGLGALSPEQCRELVAACLDHWKVLAEPRLLDHAAALAAQGDATPLYVLSMLAPVRMEGVLRDEHLAHLPPTVLEMWQEYWERLTSPNQAVLRLVKLFQVTASPRLRGLFDAAARAFELRPHELSESLDVLEKAIWIRREGEVPTCLDVQRESIILHASDLDRWDEFLHDVPNGAGLRSQMQNGTGVYYSFMLAPKAQDIETRQDMLSRAKNHFAAVAHADDEINVSLRSAALNNLANSYSDLATLEVVSEGRNKWLRMALVTLEEAAVLFRELGMRSALATALNNISSCFAALATEQTTSEARSDLLGKAAETAEVALQISEESGTRADIAMSLNNLSTRYSDLADLQTTRQQREYWLRKAATAVEEAARIDREVNALDNLAMTLSNASVYYSDLAGLETTMEAHAGWLAKAAESAEQAMQIYRVLERQGDLAVALTVASNASGELARVARTPGDRSLRLQKAIELAEEAVEIHRKLGAQIGLAAALSNLSTCYSEFADSVATPEEVRLWLEKSLEKAEESVEIYRRMGVQSELATALSNIAGRYPRVAGLETNSGNRDRWIRKAVETVEEAVEIRRALNIPGDLALSLGTASRVFRTRAQCTDDQSRRAADFRASRDAIREAVELLRESGNTPYYLISLQDFVISEILLNQAGERLEVLTLRTMSIEGRDLARSMEDAEALAFFEGVLVQLV